MNNNYKYLGMCGIQFSSLVQLCAACGGPNGNRCPFASSHGSPAQIPGSWPGAISISPAQQQALLAQFAVQAQQSQLNALVPQNAGQGASLGSFGYSPLYGYIALNPSYNPFNSTTFGGLTTPSAPLPPLESAGITVGELTGWRIWSTNGKKLRSFSQPYDWPFDSPATGAPKDYNYEGIWAFKEKARARQKLEEMKATHTWPLSLVWVLGSVSLWGEVIEHTDGYRAEFAKVASLVEASDAGKCELWQEEVVMKKKLSFRSKPTTKRKLISKPKTNLSTLRAAYHLPEPDANPDL